jgi:hypothetical protein
MDGTHPSIPLGFHAFFLLGAYLGVAAAQRHLQMWVGRRPVAMAILLTVIHHLCLSLAVGQVDVFLFFPCLLLSAPFNGLCGSLFLKTGGKKH